MGGFTCACGWRSVQFDRYEWHVERCRTYLAKYSKDLYRSKREAFEELASYGDSIKGPTGKILHGCSCCGEGFETPVEMGIHMLTECASGPQMSREELLGAAAPTTNEINEALASIADAIKE